MINSKYQPTINKSNSKVVWFSFISGVTFLLTGLVLLVFIINSQKEIFLNQTFINKVDVSLLSKDQAKEKLNQTLNPNQEFSISIKSDNKEVSSSSGQISFSFLIDKTIEETFVQTHQDFTLKKPLKLLSILFKENNFPIQNSFNENKVDNFVEEFSNLVDQKGHSPFAELETTNLIGSLVIDSGKKGLEINQEQLKNIIQEQLQQKSNLENIEITPHLEETYLELTAEQMEKSQQRSSRFIGQSIYLINNGYKDVKLIINDQDLINLISFPKGVKEEKITILTKNLNEEVKRESRNAVFDYEENKNGNFIVKEFTPHQDGLEINQEELKNKIKAVITSIDGLISSPSEIKPTYLDLPLEIVEPDITLEKTNDLGIKELIGFGDSEYDHSIPNRIWNVSLTAEKMNNILVAPGKEFRFNNTLGEVSRRTGYRSAYVISGGKTVLGDGGGVCQVSTTYFRAILNAGLEVTKRKAHSYRVSYYELNQKPGIDATVYSGDVDLRFLNDTGKHILIRSSADADELYMKVEIYGTSDGRTTEIVDHKTWGQRGAPAPAYYPTTEIPAGTFKQIDWAVSGIKASFKNVVKDKNGKLIREEEYYSNYVPWSAKYLQGI
jgi:vancomycin resistance protein YoaR